MFESDFESTDEEEEAGGDEERDSIAEKYIQEEERKMRRVRVSKGTSLRNLTMITTVLRKRKRSWSGRQLWLISINEPPSNLSCIEPLPHERPRSIGESSRRSSSTLRPGR